MWCQHNDEQNTVVLSDYDPGTGSLALLSYAHVTCTSTDGAKETPDLLRCTCNTYNTIQSSGLLDTSEFGDNEFAILDTSMTCLHHRFYKDYLQIYQDSLYSIDSSSTISQKVKQSITNINNPFILLGSPNENATTKFSVISEDTMATVH